ncbi:acetyl-CoA carboxylase biotin carboxyl carrier protein subunit [Poseidonocella sp. HB161398]|uniref:acetyl-CoA carboxylase biotin carboxyl carrier protein n=1 Tax=Poseidonocella sp. HB161398 TaxID=2320855 RepID=UPI001109992B|nr:acetyl-CoA carboxylase biotin carboxyl carrier protein subunit [Poseidonocella sp. HB161398]
MDTERLRQVIGWLATAGLEEFALTEGDSDLILRRRQAPAATPAAAPQPALAAAPAALSPAGVEIHAPLYGICYLASAPGASTFVTAGQAVKAGDPLCLIEAMKVMNTVAAPRDGTVTQVLVADGEEIEEGAVLMVLE